MPKKKVVVEEVDQGGDEVEAAIGEVTGVNKAPVKFNLNAWLQTTVEEVSRKQGVDSDPMEDLEPMSTGLLMLDIIYGGGIRPAMYTHAGDEQTAKTTLALIEMVQAINCDVPLIAFWDYEGCFIRETLLSYGRGKQAKLEDLFDLSEVESWKPGTWPGQVRTDIDTFEPGHRRGGTACRTGSLFYKGKKRITRVTFNTGHHLEGHGHKMYVLRNGRAEVVTMENLQVGEQVLISRKFFDDNPDDNRLTNLRYGSEADNAMDRSVRGRAPKGENSPTAALTETDVTSIRTMLQEGYDDGSIADVFGVGPGAIYNIRKGISWKHTLAATIEFSLNDEILRDYEVAAVVGVELTDKTEHVFDVSLRGVASDMLPHSIITNGIVTHNSTKNSKPYIKSILKTMGAKLTFDEVFGKRDHETGKWLTHPRIQYYPETVAEKFFDWLAEIERRMPDKKLIGKEWWLIYEDTKINRATLGDAHNPKMAKKYGKGLWVPAPDGNLQALIVVDSWAGMLPADSDDAETDRSLAGQARMFAKQLPRIKGRMAKKMIAMIGMNQLSDIPMAMYGPKQQEVGGKRLRYYSDVRIWNKKRSSGMHFAYEGMFDKEDGFELERSVTGSGKDSYLYVQTRTVKNKLSTSGRKGWFRIWAADSSGNGCGFDPFYDTMVYLLETGQVSGNRKKLVLAIDGQEVKKNPTWMQMKEWVLGTKEQKQKVCADLGIAKPFDLRKYLFKQTVSGKGEIMYVAAKDAKKKAEE